MGRLTISEAIEHCNEKTDCSECGQQHAQLAEWLKELQRYKDLEEAGRLIELPCAVGDTENYKMYTKFRAEIDAMYSPLVINECDEVVEIMHNTQQIGLLCVKDKYIQGLYILPEYRKKGHGRKAILIL